MKDAYMEHLDKINPFRGERGEAAWLAYARGKNRGEDTAPPDASFRQLQRIVKKPKGDVLYSSAGWHQGENEEEEEDREVTPCWDKNMIRFLHRLNQPSNL